jgi:hypothetical protein
LLQEEVFPTTTPEPGESIMRPDTIPVYLHKVRYETVKTLIIEVIVTIRDKRSGRNHNASEALLEEKKMGGISCISYQ